MYCQQKLNFVLLDVTSVEHLKYKTSHVIVVITDAIYATKFNKNTSNLISFWDCPNNDKWPPHLLVDKESKFHKMSPILPSKMSWKFSKKEECNSIVRKWQMYFQASNYKKRHFLDLNNDNDKPICPTYSKGGAWLKHFSLSNSPTRCAYTSLD